MIVIDFFNKVSYEKATVTLKNNRKSEHICRGEKVNLVALDIFCTICSRLIPVLKYQLNKQIFHNYVTKVGLNPKNQE